MIPKIIKTEKDYERALARINDLMKSGDTLLIFSL